jgi:hypothetical protein
MKFRFVFIACAVLMLCMGLYGQQGYIQGPNIYPMLTNTTDIPFIAVGGGTSPGPSTNLVGLGVVRPFQIGGRGYAMQINCSGTNQTTTTNLTITIEYSINGTDYATNLFTTWIVQPPGTNFMPCATNNPQTDVTGVMGNYAMGRIRSIHHTNTGSIFITNLQVSTR